MRRSRDRVMLLRLVFLLLRWEWIGFGKELEGLLRSGRYHTEEVDRDGTL